MVVQYWFNWGRCPNKIFALMAMDGIHSRNIDPRVDAPFCAQSYVCHNSLHDFRVDGDG
jgi:hypothetical protein